MFTLTRRRGFLDLIRQIEYYAEKSGKGKDATIEIVSPDYWSMPWYMRDYPKANFHGQYRRRQHGGNDCREKGRQDDEVSQSNTRRIINTPATYPLRPGVDLILLVRRDLADIGAKELSDPFNAGELQTVPLNEETEPGTPQRK